MMKLILNTKHEGYGTDQIRKTMTASDLIEFLQQYDENTPVYLAFDRRYTYGAILERRFEEDYDDEDCEEEEAW